MTKTLSKAILQRASFRNKFLKNPTDENKQLYYMQKIFSLSLLRKEKKNILHVPVEKTSSRVKSYGILLNHFYQTKLSEEKALS